MVRSPSQLAARLADTPAWGHHPAPGCPSLASTGGTAAARPGLCAPDDRPLRDGASVPHPADPPGSVRPCDAQLRGRVRAGHPLSPAAGNVAGTEPREPLAGATRTRVPARSGTSVPA